MEKSMQNNVFGTPSLGAQYKKTVVGIIFDIPTNQYLYLKMMKSDLIDFVVGGIEVNETNEVALKRLILEETGYTNVRFTRKLGDQVISYFSINNKNESRKAEMHGYLVVLGSDNKEEIKQEEINKLEIFWGSYNYIKDKLKILPENDSTSYGALIELLNRAEKLRIQIL